MLFILDKDYNVVGTLNYDGDLSKITTYFDDSYIQDLVTGAETFQFSTLADNQQSQHLVAGNFVAFKEEDEFKLFNIIQIEETHEDTFIKTVYCEMAGIELINEIIRPVKIVNSSIRKFMEAVLESTDWQLGKLDAGFTEVHDFEETSYKSAYQLIQEYAVNKYGAEISYRVKIEHGRVVGKYIDCYKERGNTNGFRFAYGSNLTSVSRTVDMSNLATALIGVGKNGLTFKEVETGDKPLNQDFIENETAFKQWNINGSHIFGIHEEDTESPQELLRLTRIALEERSEPKIKYEMKVELLGKEVSIGDTVNIVDHEFNPPLYLTARVNQLTKSKTNPYNDSVVLANFKEASSNITNEMRNIASQLEGYVDSQFPIGGDKIQDGAIGKQQFSKQYHTEIVSDAVYASLVETEELIAGKADIGDLSAVNATIENLKAENVEISGTLTANKAEIKELKADVAEIDHILAGNITADNIATGTIIAGSGIIADGAIGSAQISSLSADKLTSGTVETSKVDIAGAGGNLLIRGNRLQVFAGHGNNKIERVSLGDVNNDGSVYGLRVRGADGETVLMDENGVTSEGITDGSILNEHISGETKIDGYKLDINSVVREINDSTETISGTKINIDGTNLSTELSKITNTQSQQGTAISNNTANIKANQDAIKLKVDEQKYTEDIESLNKTLEKHTAEIEINKESISSKVSASWVQDQGYQTASQVQQTVDKLEIKFSESGGYNLLRNSSGYNGTANWTSSGLSGLGTFTTNASTPTGRGIYIDNGTNTSEGLLYSSRFRLAPNTTYTLSGWFCNNTSCPSFDVYVLSSTSLDETSTNSTSYDGVWQLGQHNTNGYWKEFTWTFTTPASVKSGVIRIDNNGYDSSYTTSNRVYFSSLILAEGKVPVPWSPHPNEVYDGNTIIDKNGVTIKNGGLTIKNNSGTTVLSGDTSGNLKLAGNITSGATISGGILKSTNGDMYFDMDNGYMILYNNGTKVGQTLMNNLSGTSIYGLTNGCEYPSYSCLACKTSSSASTYTMMVSVAGKDLSSYVKYGVNIGATLSSHGNNFNLHNTYLCFGLGASSYSNAGQIRWYSGASNWSWIGITNSNYIGLFGQGGFRLGARVSSTNTSYFGADATADSYNCKAHIWNNLNMHNWSIRYCQGVSTASLEINEEIPFARSASSDGEEGEVLTNSYNVVKTKQNIVETMGSVTITEDMVDKEVYIELDAYMAYKNYMVILSPVGEDRKVCILRKEDDGFYIKGNKGEVDYIIKYECIDVARYRNSTGEDAPENIVEEKENEPKPIILEQ